MNQVEMQCVMPASFVGTSSCVPYQEHVGGTQMTLLPPATHVICSIVGWVSHPWSDPSPISIAARIWNEFHKRYCLFETFYDFVTGCIRLCEASGGNDTGKMLGEPRGTLDIPKPFTLPRRRIYRGSTAQSFSRHYRFCARTKSAEVVGPVNHRPGKLEGLPALHAPLDQIGSGGVHSLRR